MEEYVGSIVISALLFIALFASAEIISLKWKLYKNRPECYKIPIYIASVTVFLIVSSCALVLYVYLYDLYFANAKEALIKSGLLFALLTIGLGASLQIIYNKIICKLFWLYELKVEIKWSFILLGIGLAILCYSKGDRLYAYTFTVLVLGKLFWLDSNLDTIKTEMQSFKELPIGYMYSLAFVGHCVFVVMRYTSDVAHYICSFMGLLLGTIGGIWCCHIIRKRHQF